MPSAPHTDVLVCKFMITEQTAVAAGPVLLWSVCVRVKYYYLYYYCIVHCWRVRALLPGAREARVPFVNGHKFNAATLIEMR